MIYVMQDQKEKRVSIETDAKGEKLVVIQDILFKGKRNINWKQVEKYLWQYVGGVYQVEETRDKIGVGKEFADEYTGSKDTAQLRGALAKAKANAAQGIPELLTIACNRRFKENLNPKHSQNVMKGWYRYDSSFALPVFAENGEVERWNVFSVEMLVRHDKSDKKYLYDIVDIKKK